MVKVEINFDKYVELCNDLGLNSIRGKTTKITGGNPDNKLKVPFEVHFTNSPHVSFIVK